MTRLHKPAVVAEHRKLARHLLAASRNNQSVSVTTLRERCMVVPADGGPFVCRARRFLETLARAGVVENVTPGRRRMVRYAVRDRLAVEQVMVNGLDGLRALAAPAPAAVSPDLPAEHPMLGVGTILGALHRLEGKVDRLLKAAEGLGQGELPLLAVSRTPRPPAAVNGNGKAAG